LIQHNRHFPAGNPLANVLVVIVGALVIGAAVVLGVVAFVALGGIILVLAAVLGVRMWWHGRKLPKHSAAAGGRGRSGPGNNTVIEGECRVVSEHRDDDRPD
jgi:uncharacterized membrane protein YphA (DoxX/SURF4 family)